MSSDTGRIPEFVFEVYINGGKSGVCANPKGLPESLRVQIPNMRPGDEVIEGPIVLYAAH